MALSFTEYSALQLHGIFAGFLDQKVFQDISARGDWYRSHLPGEAVLAKGSLPGHMVVVVHGTLELLHSNRNGAEQLFRIARAGDCLGIEAVLCDLPLPYELRALTQSTILLVPKSSLLAWIKASPAFSRRLMQVLANDVEHMYAELDGIQHNASQRFACYLHCGEGRGRRGQPVGEDFTLALTYGKLAQRLGTTQAHLSRTMRDLEKAGVIGRDGHRIKVRDRAAFSRLLCAGCRRGEAARC